MLGFYYVAYQKWHYVLDTALIFDSKLTIIKPINYLN